MDNIMECKDNKRITICVTTFNRWELCERAVNSIISQTYSEIQLILVDDCSTNRIQPSLLGRIENIGGVYIRHTTNKGLAAARNTAIKNAKGEWFSFCDDDDVWDKDTASRMLGAIEKEGNLIDVVIGLPKARKEFCHNFYNERKSLREIMINGVTPPVALQMYRTSILRCVGGYNESVSSGVDHDIWISLSEKINPIVAFVFGNLALTGVESGYDRLTTNRNRRKRDIEKSLLIWKKQIEAAFGIGFYSHFVREYDAHLKLKAFHADLRMRSYFRILLGFFSFRVIRWGINKLIYRRSSPFPCGSFEPYKHKS